MANKRNRAVLVCALALVLVATMAMAGCSSGNNPSTGGKTGTIKIGVHTSLTGGLADYGFAAEEGIKIANQEEPEVTVGGTTYKIELEIKDDKGEPAEAPVVAQSLVDDGVVGVIGCLTSGNTNAAAPIYNQAGIVEITGSATRADLVLKGWTNFFRTCVGDNYQGAELAKWVQELGKKKVVLFDDSGDYSVGLADVVEDNLEGTTVQTLRQSCKEGDTDFSAQIANIKNFGADCVVYTGYHKECGLIRKQMVEAGLGSIQMMGGDGIKSDDIVAEAGGAANATGMLCTFGGIAQDQMPGFAAFKATYKQDSGKDVGPYAETNHDAYLAIVAAIKKANSIDKKAIIDAMTQIQVDGVIGTFGFNDKGEIVMKGASSSVQTIYRYKCDGKTWVQTQ
jgi:branched-chain amino acid transport system substrate-binding protein